jgi:hypothetical protein
MNRIALTLFDQFWGDLIFAILSILVYLDSMFIPRVYGGLSAGQSTDTEIYGC